MLIELSSDQKVLLNTISRFMKNDVAPISAKMDDAQEMDPSILRKCSELGLFSMIVPFEYGGAGLDLTTFCMVIEEISKTDPAVAVTVQCSGTGLRPLLLGGGDELKKRFLTESVQKGSLWAFAITEPGSGSDTASIKTKAVRSGDKYVLSGRKCFITNGGIADFYLVFASTAPKKGSRGISAFVVPAGTRGLSAGKKEDKMGMRASPTTDLILDDVQLPAENRVGEENEGFSLLMRTLDTSRPTIGAQALGIADGALSYAVAYAKERKQFGRAIVEFQGINFLLSEMATKVESARALLYAVTKSYDDGFRSVSPYAAMTKLLASDVAMAVTTDCLQVMGGYGYMKDHPLERLMRDAKVTQIYEGTNQIQKVVISKWLAKNGYPPA
jgi:alkylation response protein AidB-like acyl-CoA dehydrogenase